MNIRKTIFALLNLAIVIPSTSQFLLISSCSKQTFPYSFFVDETIKSTKQETISQLEIADELFYQETQKHYLTTTTEIVKETFDSILLNCPHKLLNLDPVDILQKELVKNSSLVINNMKKILDLDELKDFFSPNQKKYLINKIASVCFNYQSLKVLVKNSLTLQKIVKNILEPYCDGDREQAWQMIYKIWDDRYFTGINFDHSTGYKLSTPINQIEISDQTTYTSKYEWNNVKPGDLFFSEIGFSDEGQNTGHLAIIEGKFKDPNNREYLRTIECNQYGISYGLLDDTRISGVENYGHVFRINNLTDKQINKVLDFARHEANRNTEYSCPIMLTLSTTYQPSWYCSEFIWAAYKKAGVDLNKDSYSPNSPVVTPYDIWNYLDKTNILDYKI